jgi:hypothetical protein
MTSLPHKIGFYPCCSLDIIEPIKILSNYVDEIIFCDKIFMPKRIIDDAKSSKPTPKFLRGDVRKVINKVELIDLLFYRRDSSGEGGSRVFVLGDSFFPKILEKFNPEGGLIITDGSNSRGGLFKKMKGASGLKKYGWHIQKTEDQPFAESSNLIKFKVSPCEEDESE